MGLFDWVAIFAGIALLAGALRLGAQTQFRELKPPGAAKEMPPPRTPTLAPTSAVTWQAARNATKHGLNTWISSADVEGKVAGTAGFVDGEWLLNHVFDIVGSIHDAMRQAGAPEDAATAVAQEVTVAWKTWIRGYKSGNFLAFPAFAAWPAAVAPVTPATIRSFSLRLGVSTGDNAITQELAGKLKARLPNQPSGEIDQYASWLAGRFRAWKADAYLKDLKGGGPVPSFAPPYIPVGPVAGTMKGKVGSSTWF